MATSNIKPVMATTRISNDAELRTAEPVKDIKRKSSHPVVEDQSSLTGQFTMEGVTAYYSVKNGNVAVFQLVEDATGRVIREVAPEQMMRLSSAIDEIMNHNREAAAAVKGKE